MNVLDTSNALRNISSLLQVQQFTLTADAEIQVRVDLGDTDNPIAGDALYQMRLDISSKVRDDFVDIASGITESVIQSGNLSLFSGEIVTVSIDGPAGDTDVRVISRIIDVTPVSSVVSGGVLGGVWSEEEKDAVLKALKIMKKDVRSLSERTDVIEVKTMLRNLPGAKDLTSLENTVNLLCENIIMDRKQLNQELQHVRNQIRETLNENISSTNKEFNDIREKIHELFFESTAANREDLAKSLSRLKVQISGALKTNAFKISQEKDIMHKILETVTKNMMAPIVKDIFKQEDEKKPIAEDIPEAV